MVGEYGGTRFEVGSVEIERKVKDRGEESFILTAKIPRFDAGAGGRVFLCVKNIRKVAERLQWDLNAW